VKKEMSRREDEKLMLDIVGGRNSTKKIPKDKVNWLTFLSAGFWIAAIAAIGLVAYAYQR